MDEGKLARIEQIVKCIKLGSIDTDLIKELHRLVSPSFWHIAIKYLHNLMDAEDVIQDFWADIQNILRHYQYNKNAYGYMCKVVKNRAIDRFKALHKRQKVSIEVVDYCNIIRTNKELSLEEIERNIDIDQAIKNLPIIQAKIIQSTYFESKTVRQIAKELKISKSEIERQKQAAVVKLKKTLG